MTVNQMITHLTAEVAKNKDAANWQITFRGQTWGNVTEIPLEGFAVGTGGISLLKGKSKAEAEKDKLRAEIRAELLAEQKKNAGK